MSFRTPPPDLPMCSRHDLRRQQRRILFRVPLRKQIRKFCRQRVFLRQNDAASADGTARSPRADSDFGTVGMALGASPPYLLMAAVGHILRRERRIAFIVPLCQQVSLFMPGAEIVQRRMDRCSPHRILVHLQYRRIGLLWHIVYPAQWLKKYAFLVGFKPLAYCYSVGGVLW